MPRFDKVLNAERTPARADFDGVRWTFTPEHPSDKTFVITSRSENAAGLTAFHPAREALPALDAPGWIEGYFIRDVS